MLLTDLLRGLDVLSVDGDPSVLIRSVTRDSREAGDGVVFVAIVGATRDGHDLVAAIQGGVVVVERPVTAAAGVVVVRVASTRLALAPLCAAVHGHPSSSLRVVGVTGTNGKTTVTSLVESAVSSLGVRAARIGTLGSWIAGERIDGSLTTPDAPELQALLARARSAGVDVVAMEASSIGLDQHRVDGIAYHCAVFTNLTRDHLDYHGTMARYEEAKRRLFTDLLRPPGGLPRALVCVDDPAWERVAPAPDRWTYGFSREADVRAEDWNPATGAFTVRTPLGNAAAVTGLIGRHNVQNLLGAIAVCLALGFPLAASVAAVAAAPAARGRLQPVSRVGHPRVFVDYAHTPDAITVAIAAAREACAGALWIVFGCGGDRDPGKRPEMARAAEAADHVVITSDNPRSERPESIIADIVAGCTRPPTLIESERGAAIRATILRASAADVVLLAGKGHETYQEVLGVKQPFDDVDVAQRALEER
jgi:UDP-N-acetylmuramyl-tripeptide synthetase